MVYRGKRIHALLLFIIIILPGLWAGEESRSGNLIINLFSTHLLLSHDFLTWWQHFLFNREFNGRISIPSFSLFLFYDY